MVAGAQHNERVRRIGVLVASPADDAEFQARIAAFNEGLAQLGWTEGRNVRIDTRWATTNADDLRKHAAELATSTPDVLVAASGTATVAALLQATRTVPIVFAIVSTRSAPVSSRAWRGRAATRPGLQCLSTV
jgi:putative ABC transport system substrate-binding protein